MNLLSTVDEFNLILVFKYILFVLNNVSSMWFGYTDMADL